MLTSILQIKYNLNDFASITASENEIIDLTNKDSFKGKEMASQWKPLRIWLQDEYDDRRPRALGDFASFLPGCLVMSEHAAQGLSGLLAGRGEFLKLVSDIPLTLWNCTRIVDALDPTRTRGTKFPGSRSRYIHVSRYAMWENAVDNEHVFKVPERLGDIFVSKAFSDTVAELNLTGLRLEPVEIVETVHRQVN
jgi:hypothetical protein